MAKNLPANVRSLGQEDPLGKEMAPTPISLPGKSHGQSSLVGYSPWGHKEHMAECTAFNLIRIRL